MEYLFGKPIAEKILSELKENIEKENLKPSLAVVLVGENLASKIYVSLKQKAAENVEIGFELLQLSEEVLEEEILSAIQKLNVDGKTSGIIVQLPLPKKFNTQKIISSVDPKKDVDGFNLENHRLFLEKKERFFPVFPGAILELLKSSGEKLPEKKAAVIANSRIFGETMAVAFQREGAFAEYVLSGELESNLEKIKQADIVVSAIGKPKTITGEMIKEGVIIIDGGISKDGKKVLGDVDAESVKDKASFLSPVPGGVGPVTIACLLRNVYKAAKS